MRLNGQSYQFLVAVASESPEGALGARGREIPTRVQADESSEGDDVG